MRINKYIFIIYKIKLKIVLIKNVKLLLLIIN